MNDFQKSDEFPQVSTDLALLENAMNYTKWQFSLCRPYVGKRTLEIGAGLGNYTRLLLKCGEVWPTDGDEYYVRKLRARFNNIAAKASKLRLGTLTTVDKDDIVRFRPDTIICMNVLEHVENDINAVAELAGCLSAKGRLILLVPGCPCLFSQIDREYGHYRRYDKRRIRMISRRTSVPCIHVQYSNPVGMIGWMWSHTLFGKKELGHEQVKAFDKLVPALALIQRVVPAPIGLTLLAVYGGTGKND